MSGRLIKTGVELGQDAGEELFELGAGLLGKGNVMPFEEAVKPKNTKAQEEFDRLSQWLDDTDEETFMLREERADEFGFPGYHSSGANDIFTEGNPGFVLGSHIGSTPDQASDRYLAKLGNGEIVDKSGTTYAVRVDIKNPVEINDEMGQHTVDSIADALLSDQVIELDEYMAITDAIDWSTGLDKADETEAWLLLRDSLEKRGFDGLQYDNMVEGAGEDVSYMPLRENQVRSEFAAFGDADEAAARGIPPWLAGVAGASVLLAGGTSQKAEAASTEQERLAAWLDDEEALTPTATEPKVLAASENARGIINAVTNGMLLGGTNELVSVGRALVDKVFDAVIDNPLEGHSDIIQTPQSFDDTVSMYFDDEVALKKEFRDQNPLSATALELIGGLATGGASTAVVTKMLPSAGLALSGAATGLIEGGVFGFLDNDGTIIDRSKDAATYSLLGAGFGGAVGKGIAKWKGEPIDNAALLASELGATSAHRIKNNRLYRTVTGAQKRDRAAQKVIGKFQDDLILVRATFPDATPELVAEIAAKKQELRLDDLYGAAKQLGIDIKMPSLASAAQSAHRIHQARIHGYRDNTMIDLVKKTGKPPAEVARLLAENTHDRIAKHSRKLALRMRKMEMDNAGDVFRSMEAVGNLDRAYQKLSAAGARQFKKELINNNRENAVQILKQVEPKAEQIMQENFRELAKIGKELKNVGYDIDFNPNYWPREVVDYDGLKAQLGEKQINEIERLIQTQQAKSGKQMSGSEKQKLLANYLRTHGNNFDGRAPNSKARTIDQVSEEMLDYYGDPLAAMQRYIHIAHSDINMKKMFNRSADGRTLNDYLRLREKDPEAAHKALDSAITTLVQREGLVNKLDFNEMDEFKSLFASRFGPGRKAMGEGLGQFRALGSLQALGNFSSTITQFGDFFNAILLNGTGATVKAATNQLLRRNKLDARKMGLVHTVDVATSGAGNRGWARWLDMNQNLRKTLKATGFSNLDGIAKNNLLNGSLMKYEKLAKTPKGREWLQRRWGNAFGEELPQLMDDLAAGRVTENVKLLAFNTVSDAQPISLSEMPQAYLNQPNGRIFYTLKTYAVNQLNVLKRTVSDPAYPDKTRAESAKQLAAFATLYGAMNGTVEEVKDFISGEGFYVEDLPDNFINAYLGLMMSNRYAVDNYWARGKYMEGIANAVMPVLPKVRGDARDIPAYGKTIDDLLFGAGAERAARDGRGTKGLWDDMFTGGTFNDEAFEDDVTSESIFD